MVNKDSKMDIFKIQGFFHGQYAQQMADYVSDQHNHAIRMIYNNQVTTIAGTGTCGFKDGNALEAMFDHPSGMCCSDDGKIYVADRFNHRIRMIYNGQVITVAGNGLRGCQDGDSMNATFDNPIGLCTNDSRIYIADNHNHRVRMLYNNQVTTIAGSKYGFEDGDALNSKFDNPWAICCSTDGRLYVSDRYNSRIRMIYNGKVTTIAGNGQAGFQDGNALDAMFNDPIGICCSADGRLYVCDQSNHRIRVIYNDQVITLAGSHELGFQDGNALDASFANPSGICCSNNGKLYVADQFNYTIRMICHYQDLKTPFGFAHLLDMQNNFSDHQISFNGVTYRLHRAFVNLRCPWLLDQDYFSFIEKSNISNESFESFLTFLYSDRLTKDYNQKWPKRSFRSTVELIFIFDVLLNGNPVLTDLERRYKKQLIEIMQNGSMRNFFVDLLPLIFNLKEMVKSRPLMPNITRNTSSSEYCYIKLIDELQERRSEVEQDIKELLDTGIDQCYTSIMNDMMSDTSLLETTTYDESMNLFGAELTELFRFAFHKTNVFQMERNERKLEALSTSTQNWEEWTKPDFVIKLSNDDIEYNVHKLILCGRWKYFCLMIDSCLKEVQDNQMILSDDWNKSRFEKFMKYIYLNEIEFDQLDVEWLMENRKLYGITADKIRTEKDNDQVSKNEAAYGFEDLYEYCLKSAEH